VPVSWVAQELLFDGEEDTIPFLSEHNIVYYDDKSTGLLIDTKKSNFT
jgi:hypothetical protein